MSIALALALFFTVALLAITAYFFMGSVPLLVLKHDTPMDSRFVRGFFDVYFKTAIFTAAAGAVCYAFAGQLRFAAGGAGLALASAVLRHLVVPKMDAYRGELQAGGTDAIPGFRRMHVTAILMNLAQLVVTVWSLVAVSMQMK